VAYPHGFDASNNIVIKVHASAINPVDKALLQVIERWYFLLQPSPTSFVTMLLELLKKQTLRGNSPWDNPYLLAFLVTKTMEENPMVQRSNGGVLRCSYGQCGDKTRIT